MVVWIYLFYYIWIKIIIHLLDHLVNQNIINIYYLKEKKLGKKHELDK
jgi:hypothetical protein